MAESEHFSTHLDSDSFQCIICSLNLPTYKDLYFHYKQDHVTKQQSICKICNKIFPNEDLLQKHNCNNDADHKCFFCQKSFSSSASMTIHLKRHTNKKIYKCKICYRAFFDTGNLMKHMLFHATIMADEKPFKCCLCFVSYKHKPLLAHHIRKSHLRKTLSQLKCPICDQTSKNDKMMACHIMDHSISMSRNKMTKLENEWLEQMRPKPTDHSKLPKRGRPRKLCNNIGTISTKSLQSKNSRNDPAKYNTRKRHHKINSEFENKTEQKCDNGIAKTSNDYLTNGDLLTLMNTKSSNIDETNMNCKSDIKYRTRGTNLKVDGEVVASIDSSDKTSVKLKEEQFGVMKLQNNTEQLTNDEGKINSKKKNPKYNTRDSNLKLNSGIEDSIYGKYNNEEDINDVFNKHNLSLKSNLVQSGLNPRKVVGIETTVKSNVESHYQNNTASKQRPMSFIKITSSCNKNNYRQEKILKNESLIAQKSKNAMFAKSSSDIAKKHLVGKKQFAGSQNLPNGKSNLVLGIGNIKIEDEDLEISPISNKNSYSNSNNKNKNSMKYEEESEDLVDKTMICSTKIKKEETECFIKEKKYYEPSLGLTEYSCTTCLLSFSSQDELLDHNTQHIL